MFVGANVYVLPLSLTMVLVFVVLLVVFQIVVVLVEFELVVLNEPLIEPSFGTAAKLAVLVDGEVVVPVVAAPVVVAAVAGAEQTLTPTPDWLLLF